jgi:PAS domain S-box-containing protein
MPSFLCTDGVNNRLIMISNFKAYFVNKLKESNFFGLSGSILNRMLLTFVPLVVLPAMAIVISSTIIGIRSGRRSAIEQLESVASLKKQAIQYWTADLKNNLVHALSDEKTNASLLVLLSKKDQKQGAREDAHQYIRDRFHGYQNVSNDFDELSLILPNGDIVLTTAQEMDPDVSVLQPYFKEKLSEPKILFQKKMLAVFMPVKDPSGETAGIIYARTKPDKLIEIMRERSGLGESGETYLVGLDYTLLTPSRFANYHVGTTHVYTEGAMDALDRHLYAYGLYQDYRGIPIIGVYLWLPELKAALLAERDQDEVFSSTYSGIIINLVVAFLALFLAIIASFIYSKTLTEPIRHLAATATRIAEGDLALKTKVERQDEIGMLANAFNCMTEQLTASIGQLEARLMEIKQNEKALRASETRYRIVADNTYDWEFWQNPDGQFLYVSPSCEEITGYKAADFEADPDLLLQIIDPEDLPVYEAHCRAHHGKQVGAEAELEFRIVTFDKTPRWIGHVCKPLFNGAGEFLGQRGSNRDITHRKLAEEELHKFNQKLEQRVRDRTAKLEAANEELQAFSYTVSHDLRAPLRHIEGFIELLQKKAQTTLDEQSRHYMDTISEAANKMGLLIEDLVAFSRMGHHAMSFRPVALGPLVRDVIRDLESDAAGRVIEWRIGNLPVVGGDAFFLRIVLVNLIANAIKFTRPRKQARIEIGSLPGQDFETVIFVRDNGVGFDMTYADKLFCVFKRLHRADEFEGTGIGLASARRIITRHGGRTWAEGKPDQGAAFYFALPHTLQGRGAASDSSGCPDLIARIDGSGSVLPAGR